MDGVAEEPVLEFAGAGPSTLSRGSGRSMVAVSAPSGRCRQRLPRKLRKSLGIVGVKLIGPLSRSCLEWTSASIASFSGRFGKSESGKGVLSGDITRCVQVSAQMEVRT